EHERAVGAWQAEWVAIPDIFRHTAGAVAHVRRALEGLEVDEERMRANLDLAGGALMAESLGTALAGRVGAAEAKEIAKRVSERAARERLTLRDAALGDARLRELLSPDDVDRALDPARYLGAADALIDRALATRTETT